MKLKSKLFNIFIILIVLITFPTAKTVHATGTCYVNSNATGGNNGISWANAYVSLQTALADSCTEIWVAAGTYKPDTSLPIDDRSLSFALETGTAIYGGFSGTETLLSQRDPVTNVTILSGDLSGNDSGFTNNGENSYHVVYANGMDNTAVLDGFTIIGGNANGSSTDDRGGGVYLTNTGATLANLTLRFNVVDQYGGGVYADSGTTSTLTNMTFRDNSAFYGGGLYQTVSAISLSGVTFSNNSASYGGGMMTVNQAPTLTNMTFSGNSASSSGGGIYAYNSYPILTNVTISGNSAGSFGGGYYNDNAGVPVFTNVIIANSLSGGDCAFPSGSVDGASRNNLVEDTFDDCGLTNGVNGDIIGADPNLGPLTNNGGSTQTFALLPGSTAINSGTNTGCPSTDQRGVTRPQRGACDIGAYEYGYTGVYFVKPTSSGTGDCQSWTNACKLQTALSTVISGDEVWVAAGTHTPHTSDRTISFNLVADVEIYGGFAGTETLVTQRNSAANVTILSGDLSGDDSGTNDGLNTSYQENSYHVVLATGGLSINTVLDGFTITGGYANNPSGSPTYYENGGGMYNSDSSATLTNLIFSNNYALGGGGGLNIYYSNGTSILTNVTFNGNYAGTGGGLYNNTNSSTLTNVTFSNNHSYSNGGGMYNFWLAPVLTNVTFSGNSADANGGGLFNVSNNSNDPTLMNVTFSGNTASSGGGLYNNSTFSGTARLNNVIIANSTSGGDCVLASGSLNGASSNNLIENGSTACGLTNGVNGNIIGTDPGLGPLANNGGTTQTHTLMTGSPAIDSGTNTGCTSNDQRGLSRPQDSICDIGAIESNVQAGPGFVVNVSDDSDDGACEDFISGVSDCTLREAINTANNLSGANTITFAADYTITLNSQLPAVTGTTIITGNGSANTILQANAAPGNSTYRIFLVSTGNLTLNQLNIRHGLCNGVCESATGVGGGIYVSSGGTLAINNSLVSANYAFDGGGGIYNNFGTVTITNSSFSTNISPDSGGAITNAGSMTIANSTIASNTATGGGFAGGIRNLATLAIYNSTISGNTSNSGVYDGANIVQEAGTLNLYNTIIANGVNDGDCGFYGGTVSATNTLIESSGALACNLTNGVNGNIIGLDPSLGVLIGSPAYFLLNNGSPAINAGNDTICAAAPVNNISQGGATRPIGAHCDIGSYETGAEINVTIGGTIQSSHILGSSENQRASYADLNSGPVKVEKTNLQPIIASERVAYTPDGGATWTSFDEMMGLPSNQLTDTYYFPYYNNVEMNTQLRFGNVGTSNTVVTVTIGGVVQGNYFVIPNQSMRLFYNLNAGPVKVQSSGGVPIIASIRFANIQSTSPLVVPAFTEMMGLPGNQLTSTYIFPYYNNVEMNTQLRFGNVGTSATNVTVTIGGVVQGVYPVAPSQSVRLFYNLNSGPVKVQSSGGVPIIASMRFAKIQSESPLVISYFSEMLGLPQASLSTNYWFPVYDNVTHNMQLRFGNMGTTSTTVTVRIGGTEQGSYVVLPNQSQRLFYSLNDGPVQVQSSGGVPIIASIRFAYIESASPLVIGAFSEMLGLPAAQLSSTYLFPWYNNDELDTQMRIAVP